MSHEAKVYDPREELKALMQHILSRDCNPGLMETTRVYLLSRQIAQSKPN